jgi:hypothetical protein
MSERYKILLASKWAYLVYGVVICLLVLLGIRYVTYSSAETHYHANFAVYLNGTRESFKSPQYYQEVKICDLHGTVTPQMRTHMHNEEAGIIHGHDDGVTWGQFFENLGWYIGPDFIRTTDKLYTADEVNKLHIVLNGDDLTGLSTITNEVIGDRDRLLVSFGSVEASVLDTEYKSVPKNADEYDHKNDPTSCGGLHEVTPGERLKHLF